MNISKIMGPIAVRRKYNNQNNTNYFSYSTIPQHLKAPNNDTFSRSNTKDISFGITVKDFPFDYDKFDFIIPNNVLRRVKPNIEKIVQEIEIPSTDGLKLKSWFIAPKENKPVFLFLNGTNSNRTHQEEVVKFFDENGFGALMPDYRGFAENTGVATEKGLYEDAASSLSYLNKKGYKNKELVLWGYSMGGGVARTIATMNDFRCAIIDSAIKNEYLIKKHFLDTGIANKDNISPTAVEKFKKQLFSDEKIPFDTSENIKNIKYPVLFLHSKGDHIVPHWMTEDQFALSANKDSKLVISEGTDPHFYRKWTFPYIKDFVDSIK